MAYGAYFRGDRCNEAWELLESVEAKRLRGGGWRKFCSMIRRERGAVCQRCGRPEDWTRQQTKLHVHHVLKVRTHRHLRFEKSNVFILCQPCHVKHEMVSEIVGGIYKDLAHAPAGL